MQVQITKIKISKEKTTGRKLSAIELMRLLSEEDEYEGEVAKAINQLAENEGIDKIALSTVETPRSLSFQSSERKGTDMIPSCSLEKFKLRRERTKAGDLFYLSFEFTIPLIDAKRWLIPSIGDTVSVTVEHTDMPLPFSASEADKVARPN